MCDRDFFITKFQSCKIIAALNAEFACVTLERGPVIIIVSPHKQTGHPRKKIENAFTAHIAAMNEEL